VSGYSGNAGRDAFGWQNGMMFSTFDDDNDHDSSSCAVTWILVQELLQMLRDW